MEKLLLRLAEQLDSIDEASLMALWPTYAKQVSVFEPTKRWEMAALILGLIQAKYMKNNLFNHHWAKQSNPPSGDQDSEPMPDFAMNFSLEDKPKEPCRILAFKPLKEPGGDGK